MPMVHDPRMPPLAPMALASTLPSCASVPLAFLVTVDHIEVNESVVRDGVMYYVIDMFLEHYSSRIPTNKSEQTRLSSSQPEYRVEHRFNDFVRLRYQVWSYAQRKHENNARCRYCDEYMHFLLQSLVQPRLRIKFGTCVCKRKQLLSTFCNELIAMAVGAKMASRSQSLPCKGYQVIPHLVERCFRKRQ